MKKIVKTVLWIVGIVVALLAVVSLFGGPVAKGYVNSNGEKLTGRNVHVDHVGVNLFSGRFSLRDMTLYEDDGTSEFVSFDTLDVRMRLLALIGKKVDVRRLLLSGLDVNVTQDGERFNFSSLIDHFAKDDEEDNDTTPSSWVVKLGDLRINHARATYEDVGRNKQWNVADMNLHVPGFIIGGKGNTQAGLNIELEDGGRLNINADYDAASNDFVANINLGGFALANVKEYVEDHLAVDAIEGTLDAALTAKGNVSEVMKTGISGEVGLDGVAVTDRDSNPLAALKSLAVSIEDINLDQNRFAIRSIAIDGFEAVYAKWADGTNISKLQKSDTSEVAEVADTSDQSDKPKSKPMQLSIGSFVVTGSSVTYYDHTLPDKLHFPITDISIEAQNVSTSGSNGAKLRATLPGGGRLAVNWHGTLAPWTDSQDLLVSVKGLDMRQLSPWLVDYAGQPMEDGVFGLTSHNTVTQGALSGRNSIDIYKAVVGDRRKGVKPKQKLPLKAALYVLKDKDDKILIDLPVSGNVNDPEFNYMKIVWKTLGNLIVKVATSPLRAVSSAFEQGSNGEDFMPIEANQHTLTSEQYHALSEIARAGAADTLMTIEMTLHMDDADRAEALNKHVRRYLVEQGMDESRLNMAVAEPLDGRTGYTVTSQLKIDE